MFERFFSMLGREISNSVSDVVHSEEFRDLKQEVKDTFHDAVGEGSSRRRSRRSRHRSPQPPISSDPSVQADIRPLRYSDSRFPWKQVSSILLLIFGGVFALTSLLLMVGVITMAATGQAAYLIWATLSTTIPFGGISAWMITQGCRIRGRLNRIVRYLSGVGNAKFCSVDQLAKLVRKTPAFVVKDLEKMIRSNMLPDGYLDDQKTCLMLGEETYQQYLHAQQSMEERERRNYQKEEQEAGTAPSKGRELLNQISQAKIFITDEVILLKISRLESVTEKILNYVEEHPEKESQIRKFNDYYLPTTLKLIHSYCHFDSQPVQGENITSAKKQIRESLDTINTAFENLLDSLFGDATMDISSDISVLEVMLAREGLTGDDFKKSDNTK
ncbi:5-bromo-4-chloroindolyl phosphate hydrolysis family protein [Faecalispora anaeroviscerum]|uniref:5-bromo-4-chloroindolyl phosphate hydrolysis family protein n=1 Tax=Faecalispora anaeroviscerum TaxID=2991836 RepID=UPI0024BABF4D|nr:5-bromo-4-chloroindolyl phosphate hydrolysis family protein [Faecalispora anaeroviscerum]